MPPGPDHGGGAESANQTGTTLDILVMYKVYFFQVLVIANYH